MKKKLVPATLIITAIIIILGVVGYYTVIRPIYNNNAAHEQAIRLENKNTMAFGKHERQGAIFGIEIEVSGQSASNFDMVISNGKQDVHAATIKGKNIDFIYKNDWYEDSCFLQFFPRGEKRGKVNAKVRFLSMD